MATITCKYGETERFAFHKHYSLAAARDCYRYNTQLEINIRGIGRVREAYEEAWPAAKKS